MTIRSMQVQSPSQRYPSATRPLHLLPPACRRIVEESTELYTCSRTAHDSGECCRIGGGLPGSVPRVLQKGSRLKSPAGLPLCGVPCPASPGG